MDEPLVPPDETDRAIEALVMVAEDPVAPGLLAQLLEISVAEVEQRCEHLAAQYAFARRGFELVRLAGGYRFQTHPDLAPYIERYVLDGQSAKLSGAAMETLAIVAYKQPISRAQVASIRGVNVDGVMRTLQQRGYVVEVGKDPGPGQATLYGTTGLFLERVGLDSLDQLVPLGEFVPPSEVVEALEHVLVSDGDPRRRRTAGEPAGTDHGARPSPFAHGAGIGDETVLDLRDLTGEE